MRHSEQFSNISKAIAKVQRKVRTVEKTKGVDAGQIKYKYAPLDEVWLLVLPELEANELTVIQGGREGAGGTQWLTTLISHSSGEWIEGDNRVESSRAGMQGLSAAWSYSRRIALLGMLGIVPAGEDTDSADEMKGRAAKPPRQTAAARPVGVTDDRQLVEQTLLELDNYTTEKQVDEAAQAIRDVIPADMVKRVRERFGATRARIKQQMRAQ